MLARSTDSDRKSESYEPRPGHYVACQVSGAPYRVAMRELGAAEGRKEHFLETRCVAKNALN